MSQRTYRAGVYVCKTCYHSKYIGNGGFLAIGCRHPRDSSGRTSLSLKFLERTQESEAAPEDGLYRAEGCSSTHSFYLNKGELNSKRIPCLKCFCGKLVKIEPKKQEVKKKPISRPRKPNYQPAVTRSPRAETVSTGYTHCRGCGVSVEDALGFYPSWHSKSGYCYDCGDS